MESEEFNASDEEELSDEEDMYLVDEEYFENEEFSEDYEDFSAEYGNAEYYDSENDEDSISAAQLLARVPGDTGKSETVAVDILEDAEACYLFADVPGFSRADIQVPSVGSIASYCVLR